MKIIPNEFILITIKVKFFYYGYSNFIPEFLNDIMVCMSV